MWTHYRCSVQCFASSVKYIHVCFSANLLQPSLGERSLLKYLHGAAEQRKWNIWLLVYNERFVCLIFVGCPNLQNILTQNFCVRKKLTVKFPKLMYTILVLTSYKPLLLCDAIDCVWPRNFYLVRLALLFISSYWDGEATTQGKLLNKGACISRHYWKAPNFRGA